MTKRKCMDLKGSTPITKITPHAGYTYCSLCLPLKLKAVMNNNKKSINTFVYGRINSSNYSIVSQCTVFLAFELGK
jgi:predicted class III extradiol MEMO1 family dioxygenase